MTIKRLLFIPFVFTMISCGNNTASSAVQSTGNANNEDISAIEMFKATDCATCHKKNEKLVGPSFTDIAKRYSNAADTTIARLALTIINGGSGNWGAAAPMMPHPALSKTDAENMVKYILQLNK